jgi:hypothetical protein
VDNRQLSRNNCYWNAGQHPVAFAGKTLAEWQDTPVHPPQETNTPAVAPDWAVQGRELGSIIADPHFVDPERHDFRLLPDSPAFKIGFKPFDYSEAGVYGDAAWVAKARETPGPEPEVYPPPKLAE